MKNLFNVTLTACFLAMVLFFTACEEDEPNPDNALPALSVSDTIIGMTGVINNIAIQASDPDGDALEISSEIIESPTGSSPVIEFNGMTMATFTTNIAGLYKVEVTANDGKGKTASAVVTLLIGGVLPTSINANTLYPDLFENEAYPDYYALQSVQVTAGIALEPGVVIEYGSDARLWINGNLSYLKAEGTDAKNIIFRGIDKVKGSWKAIQISSNNVNNKLNYVQILHAGSSESSNQKTALFLQSNTSSKLSIKNTTISQSAGYALYVDGNSGNITEFESNNFSNNDAAPIRFGAENMYILDKNSVYTNNGIQAIEIAAAGNTNAVFNNSGTVPHPGLSYHIYSSLELRAEVNFESAVTCRFFTGKRLWVTAEGSIIAKAITDPISFTGLDKTAGSWFGFEIASPSPSNFLDGVIISYGGYSGGRGANIYMFGSSPGSQLTITNSVISDSQTLGIWARPGTAVLNESNNTFSNNALGNVRID